MILIKVFIKTWALFLLNIGWQLEQKRLTKPQTVFSRLLTVLLRRDKQRRYTIGSHEDLLWRKDRLNNYKNAKHYKSRSTVYSGSIKQDEITWSWMRRDRQFFEEKVIFN